jgi:hypothetical protein
MTVQGNPHLATWVSILLALKFYSSLRLFTANMLDTNTFKTRIFS